MMSAVDTFESIKAEDFQAVDILKSKVHFCKNEQDWEEYKYCMNEAFNSVTLNWNVVFGFLSQGIDSWMARPRDVLKVLKEWKKVNVISNDISPPADLLETVFYRFVKNRNPNLVIDIFQVFHFQELKHFDFVRLLQELGETDGEYIRVFEIVHAFDLHEWFELDDLLIPLILCNPSTPELLNYLKKVPKQAEKLVSWIDKLDIHQLNDAKLKYSHCKKLNSDRLAGKPKSNFLKLLITKLSIDEASHAPIHWREMTKMDIRYHIRQKGAMAHWRDIIRRKVKIHSEFQFYLVEQFLNMRGVIDIDEAVYWANEFQLDESMFTSYDIEILTKARNEGRGIINDSDDFNEEELDNDLFYSLKLNSEDIVFVSSLDEFDEMVKYISQQYVIGLDCEFTHHHIAKVAIMQLACEKRAFVLDMIVLVDSIPGSKWQYFVDEILTPGSGNMILAYEPRNDLQALFNSSPNVPKSFNNLLDMKIFVEELEKQNIIKLNETNERGLAGLTERLLGAPLNKYNQCSDWSQRPLQDSQIKYAALDAHVLIELYNKLYSLVEDNDGHMGNFSKLEMQLKKHQNKLNSGGAKSKKSKKSHDRKMRYLQREAKTNVNKENDTEESAKKNGIDQKTKESIDGNSDNSNLINPPDLKVVCDNMLEGLCKKLRMLGVNAIAIKAHEHWETCGVIAQDENRCILTRHRHFETLSNYVIPKNCLALQNETPEEQVKEVFSHFQVKDTNEYIFSRCMKCNCDQFIHLKKEFVKEIQENMKRNNSTDPDRKKFPEYYDEWKNGLNVFSGKTKNNVQLKVNAVPESVIHVQEEFYGCESCGQMYWEGSHWNRVLKGK